MNNALIWGAAGGIGRATVTQLRNDGWTVIAVARNARELENTTPHTIDADVASAYDVQAAVQAASQFVSEVNLWLYCVGDITSAKVGDMQPADWQRIVDANLTGAFLTTHYSLPLLSSDAHLFYLGAVSERLRLPGLAAYAAAKAGLEAYAQTLGKEQRRQRVTVIRPGAVDTPFWEKVPLRLPANALSPDAVARQIVDAYGSEHRGFLDLPST